MSTNIEWTEETWNPVRGCTRVSEGCRNCYAERRTARFSRPGLYGHGFAARTPAGPRWTGRVELLPKKLREPLSWRKPKLVFVNSMSDLFHEALDSRAILDVFMVMAACRRHTFQILTKRPLRARLWFQEIAKACANEGRTPGQTIALDSEATWQHERGFERPTYSWPLPNVWIGTSVEDQATVAERIPHLLDVPAALRFLSAEPLLAAVDLENLELCPPSGDGLTPGVWLDALRGHLKGPDDMLKTRLDWVIAGGESGAGARPMHPDWPRSLRDQCEAAGIPFFFKQWGAWNHGSVPGSKRNRIVLSDGSTYLPGQVQIHEIREEHRSSTGSWKAGLNPTFICERSKRTNGNSLDGRTHEEYPVEVRP